MTGDLKYLMVESVLAIHAEVLAAHGGGAGLRSRPLLESAVAAPQATMMGQLLIPEPLEIADGYLFSICSNYPFVDGNKRVSLASCLVFLSENGLLPDESLNTDHWKKLTLDVACGSLTRDEVTVRLRALLQQS
jgi:death-on-curing protein